MNDAVVSESAEARHLGPDNPLPGLDAFDEAGRDFFHGRDGEAEELLHRVASAPVTVLFGKSGLGKTSLLKAGLFPRLRQRRFLPVYIRLDVRPEAPPLIGQMRVALLTTVRAERVDAPRMEENETLWEYLHRVGLEFWSADNYPLMPVLVCDQFEEIFTLGKRLPAEVQTFSLDLGDLAENRIPPSLRGRLDRGGGDGQKMDLRAMRYKLVVSLREDFLPDLEGWRRAMPSLGRVRVRLLPMNRDQALSAVYETAPHLMDEALGKRLVQFVAAEQTAWNESDCAVASGNGSDVSAGEIEPALLSLFCRGLNERRKARKKARFDDELLESSKQGIISDYYQSCMEGVPESVSRFIETELITEKGYRDSFAKEDAIPAFLTQEQLDGLISRRLLRVEERQGAMRIELTHDVLTRAVRQHRDWRRAAEERAQLARQAEEGRRIELEQLEKRRLEAEAKAGKRFRRLTVALALILVFAVGMAIVALRQWRDAEEQSKIAAQATIQEKIKGRLAQDRLDLIRSGIRLKQAILSGDRERIREALSIGRVNTTIRFTAHKQSLGYRDGKGREIYRFSLLPEKATLPQGTEAVTVVTYAMDHPTFENTKLIAGPDRDFTANYDGWGCITRVVVLIEYVDPDRFPEVAEYDMCSALGS